jgi:hypothetical protein
MAVSPMTDPAPAVEPAPAWPLTWFDLATKYIPTATALCLATALAYDAVFWWIVDSRVLHLFVLADHIETAVYVVTAFLFGILSVWAVLNMLLMMRGGTRKWWRKRDPKRTRLYMIFLLMLCVLIIAVANIMTGVFTTVPKPADIAMGLVYLAIIFMFSLRRRNRGRRTLYRFWRRQPISQPVRLAALWCLVTVFALQVDTRLLSGTDWKVLSTGLNWTKVATWTVVFFES